MNSCRFILKAETPTTIAIADKPLNLGGQIEYLSIEEFQNRFGITYNDGISINSKTKIYRFEESVIGEISASELKKQVKKVLKVAFKNLIVCSIINEPYCASRCACICIGNS